MRDYEAGRCAQAAVVPERCMGISGNLVKMTEGSLRVCIFGLTQVSLLLLVPGSYFIHRNSDVSNSFVRQFLLEVVEPVGTCTASGFYEPLSLPNSH